MGRQPPANSRPMPASAPPPVNPSPPPTLIPAPMTSPSLPVSLLSILRPRAEASNKAAALTVADHNSAPFSRHTPVILMGAAILSDGRAAASCSIPSAGWSAILQAGKRSARKSTARPWLGPA